MVASIVMKTHAREWTALDKTGRFLFCSADNGIALQLGAALSEIGLLTQEALGADTVAVRVAQLNPQAVLLDFTPDPAEPGKLLRAAELARILAKAMPHLPRVAVGSLAHPEGAVAALRAGVSDFVDPVVDPGEVRDVIARLVRQSGTARGQETACRSVVLLGARPGVGTSTLAVHLAGLVQARLMQAWAQGNPETPNVAGAPGVAKPGDRVSMLPLSSRVGLLDFGWPVGDCLLYLNLKSDFDFSEAVRNLRRLDTTLLSSALAHTDGGINVLALPHDMNQMRNVSHADSLTLYEQLRRHFGLLLSDAGGLSDPEFAAGLARAADETWLVTDQSVGSLVSLADLLQQMEQRHVARESLRLVVNRYDERYGMTAGQIAQRFSLPLIKTLPDRALPLMQCTSQGRLLYEQSERDPYVKAVDQLADRLGLSHAVGAARAGWLATWLPGVHKRMRND